MPLLNGEYVGVGLLKGRRITSKVNTQVSFKGRTLHKARPTQRIKAMIASAVCTSHINILYRVHEFPVLRLEPFSHTT